MSVVGDMAKEEVFGLAEKWFGDIEKRQLKTTHIEKEPPQTEKRTLRVERSVPSDALFMAFHMDERLSRRYDLANMLSDILSNGKSSRLNQNLVKKRKLFSKIDAFITGSIDAGLFAVKGDLMPGVTMEQAEEAVWEELSHLKSEPIGEKELQKIKNRLEAMLVFEDMSLLNKAMQLAYFEMLGDAGMINKQAEVIQSINNTELLNEAAAIFNETNCSVVYYYAQKN